MICSKRLHSTVNRLTNIQGTAMTKYLSKSRFKVALECPRKLAYLGNDAYVNTKKHNDFLKSLAEGGFQVGELAKLLYPGGIEIEDVKQADQISGIFQASCRLNVA